ncbi:MAG: hypothetical protein AAF586_02030 [Planctomycetota bacterium]
MTFPDPTPDAPLPDLGLACRVCGYPLAGVTRLSCPECGDAFALDDYIPEGAFPPLIADGQAVRYSADLAELFAAYHLPIVEMHDPIHMIFGGGMVSWSDRTREGAAVAVARERWLEAVDLIRRWRQDEELPAPPEPVEAGPDWACAACGEENPGHFQVCWNCTAPR